MGCFNVTCSVLRVPIREEEKCHAVILKDPELDTLASGEHFAFEALIRASLLDIVSGRYDDYGGITGKGRWGYGAVDQAWFISEPAWQEGVALCAKEMARSTSYIKSLFNLDVALDDLLKLGEKAAKIGGVKKALAIYAKEMGRRGDYLDHLDDIRILACLHQFCRANGLNLFDPAIQSYSTQSTHVPERRHWTKLRSAAITRLKTS